MFLDFKSEKILFADTPFKYVNIGLKAINIIFR